MAVLKPFSCIRPAVDHAAEVAARPYDVLSEEEVRREVEKNPCSFLNITRPEVHFPRNEKVEAQVMYEKAHEQMEQWLKEGILEEEQKEAYYVYELSVGGHQQTGLVGCASVDDYWNQVVRKHEAVRQEKLEDRTRHINITGAQTGPVFLAYRSRKDINQTIEQVKHHEPLYDFKGADSVHHKIWKITDPAVLAVLERGFGSLGDVYIADGHHRAFAAARVCEEMRKKNPGYTGQEPFNYFLCVCFPDEQLQILPYNRVVADLNGLDAEEFLKKVEEKFDVTLLGETSFYPKFKGVFGMCLDGKWYRLAARREILSKDPVKGLDVSLLQDHLLAPILGIQDPKTDKRIDFVGGIRGLRELELRCRTDMRVAFSMFPTSIRELFSVADAGLLMPPKSTWFEPKLASGLFIHRI